MALQLGVAVESGISNTTIKYKKTSKPQYSPTRFSLNFRPEQFTTDRQWGATSKSVSTTLPRFLIPTRSSETLSNGVRRHFGNEWSSTPPYCSCAPNVSAGDPIKGLQAQCMSSSCSHPLTRQGYCSPPFRVHIENLISFRLSRYLPQLVLHLPKAMRYFYGTSPIHFQIQSLGRTDR